MPYWMPPSIVIFAMALWLRDSWTSIEDVPACLTIVSVITWAFIFPSAFVFAITMIGQVS